MCGRELRIKRFHVCVCRTTLCTLAFFSHGDSDGGSVSEIARGGRHQCRRRARNGAARTQEERGRNNVLQQRNFGGRGHDDNSAMAIQRRNTRRNSKLSGAQPEPTASQPHGRRRGVFSRADLRSASSDVPALQRRTIGKGGRGSHCPVCRRGSDHSHEMQDMQQNRAASVQQYSVVRSI